MEAVAAKTTAMETAGVKPAPMKTAAVEASKFAPMEPATKPATASAMCTSISHA